MSADTSKLARLNPHSRDGTIVVDESAHRYWVRGMGRSYVSVTTLIKWYLPSVDPIRLVDLLLTGSDSLWKGMKRDEILRHWADKGKEARFLGTRLHSAIELYYNGIDPAELHASSRRDNFIGPLWKEWSQFLLFNNRYNLIPYRTEMPIYSLAYGVAGTVDFIARNNDGSVSLYDWKRSKANLDTETFDWDENGVGPLRTYPNTSFGRYSLQLNLYRVILEEEYGLVVRDMYIVRFHQQFASYEIFVILRSDHASRLLSHYRGYSIGT